MVQCDLLAQLANAVTCATLPIFCFVLANKFGIFGTSSSQSIDTINFAGFVDARRIWRCLICLVFRRNAVDAKCARKLSEIIWSGHVIVLRRYFENCTARSTLNLKEILSLVKCVELKSWVHLAKRKAFGRKDGILLQYFAQYLNSIQFSSRIRRGGRLGQNFWGKYRIAFGCHCGAGAGRRGLSGATFR